MPPVHTRPRRRALHALAAAPLLPALGGLGACAGARPAGQADALAAGGRFETMELPPSRHAAPRRVVVWLPPGYDPRGEPAPVLYMHDGQNLFDPAQAFGGEPWGVQHALAALIHRRAVPRTLVVAVWNTPLRWREYVPAEPLATLPAELLQVIAPAGSEVADPRALALSDGYLRFLAEELKPLVDARYRTRPQAAHTAVMGSSMGGLVSLYALIRYPQVFGAAGCVSTHWPVTTRPALLREPGGARMTAIAQHHLDFVRRRLPPAGRHRLWFDHGTLNLDALYAPFQQRMDAILRERGYRQGADSHSQVFDGADHNERSWRARVALPLGFLLGGRDRR